MKSVTEGIDAQGEVTIRVEGDGRSYVGRGADTDIIVASAKAYMNALNRMLVGRAPRRTRRYGRTRSRTDRHEQTLSEKIWDAHVVDSPCRDGAARGAGGRRPGRT